jgi:hypothetical protein
MASVFSLAEEDAQRRDFTINGMFYDPIANAVVDPVGGQQDLAAGVVLPRIAIPANASTKTNCGSPLRPSASRPPSASRSKRTRWPRSANWPAKS